MTTSSAVPPYHYPETKIQYGDLVVSDQPVSNVVGAYGEVLRARIGRLACAAKIFYCSEASDQEKARVRLELHELTVLQHPHLVQCILTVWDVAKELPIQLMELLDESLAQYIDRQDSAIPYYIKVNLCKDTALALSYLHLNGIVHGDLTGNNILILKEVRAKVTDYWMTSIHRHGEKTDITKIPEKIPYVAPERMKNAKNISMKSDSYSYGVIMSYIDTQCAPVPHQIKVSPPESPLAKIARQCLSKKPDGRPVFDEICLELEELIDAEYAVSLDEAKLISIKHVMQAQVECQLNDLSVEQLELKSRLAIMQEKVDMLQKDNDNLKIKLIERETENVSDSTIESSNEDITSTDTQQVVDGIFPVDQLQLSDVVIGQGESATVYKASWQSRLIAYKHLKYHQNRPQKWMTNFYHEASVLSRLSHHNVVKILGITTSPGRVGIVLELMGDTLQEILFNPELRKSLPSAKKNRIVRSVGIGLEYLHSHDIHHGRLSPRNVLVSEDNIYKVANYGPKYCQRNFSSYHIIEDESESYFYSAPEVLRRDIMSCKQFKKADVYSLAMLAYEILSQKHCFEKDITKWQLVSMVVQYRVRPNLDCLQGVPDSTKDLLVNCWDNNPDIRATTKDFVSVWKEHQKV